MFSPNVTDHLLDPCLLKVAKRLRAGGAVTLPMRTRLPVHITARTEKQLASWLKSGDVRTLADVLAHTPMFIAHAVVFWQIVHLSRLARTSDQGDLEQAELEGASVTPKRLAPAPPRGTRKAARDALEALVTAWAGGLLPWRSLRLGRAARTRGRPRRLEGWESKNLLDECNEFLEQVEKSGLLARQRREGPRRFLARIGRAVQSLHLKSWRSYLVGSTKTDLRIVKRRLPSAVARRIARRALRKTGASTRARLIAYGLLAHYEGTTLGSIRGLIERAEADHPTLARRRPQ